MTLWLGMEVKPLNGRRVCMLVHNYYLRDNRVRKEAECLAEAGFFVDAIGIKEPREFGLQNGPSPKVVNGVTVHELNIAKRRGGYSQYLFEYFAILFLGASKILRMHLKKRFDVVHIHNMPDFLILAGLLPKLTGAKLVLDIHDPMVELYTSNQGQNAKRLFVKALAWQEKLCCRLANKVISVNETMRENLEQKGVAKDKIFIVNNYPDMKTFPVHKDLTSWPIQGDRLTLLFTGTITDHYDLGVAVTAVAIASQKIPNLNLRLVGAGNKITEILNMAEGLGIRDRIEFSGSVPASKVSEEMKKAHVGISTHKAGVFGDLYFSTKIVEYMTQGLPVVCSRTHTIERYVPDDAIFYFEPGNPEDMAQQIIAIWQDPELVKKKINAAMRLVHDLSWGREKPKLVSFYRNLAGQAEQSQGALMASSEDLAKKAKTWSREDSTK